MSAVPDHLAAVATDRGFAWLPPLPGAYGGHVQVRESSSAAHPRLWLDVVELDDLNGPADGPTHKTTIYLDAEEAWKLADQLRHAVVYHYHGDSTPEWAQT